MTASTARVWTCLRIGMAAATFALWLVGQVLRDRFWWTALCFYLPAPLAAGVLASIAVLSYLSSSRRMALVVALLALGPVFMVVWVENHWTTSSLRVSPTPSQRLVHWNVFGGSLSWSRVQKILISSGADVIVLSEVPGDASLEVLAAQLGQDYCSLRLDNMALIARGRLSADPRRLDQAQARAFLVGWQSDAVATTLLVIDLPSSLAVARDPLLGQVRELIANDRPDLVVGDFNAPRRSLVLSQLPDGYAHAYALAGSGWSYTWPVPCPLWAIDQCIVGPRICALSYHLRSTVASDHRLQLLDFVQR